jgi:hypothetical protein
VSGGQLLVLLAQLLIGYPELFQSESKILNGFGGRFRRFRVFGVLAGDQSQVVGISRVHGFPCPAAPMLNGAPGYST